MTRPPAAAPRMSAPARAAAAAAVAIAALAAACGDDDPPAAPPAPASPPDVLVVMLDTTRGDRCSFLGYERATTPRLDEFARECVVFEDAWSPGSWTFPTHAAMFTGREPTALGVADGSRQFIPDDVPTLAEILSARGFAAGCFTANAWIAPHTRLTRGFGMQAAVYASAPDPKAKAVFDPALNWMRAQRKAGRRFFAFTNVVEPHAPWTPSAETQARFLRDGTPAALVEEARGLRYPRTALAFVGDPRSAIGPELRATVSDLYDAEIADADRAAGDLLDAMRRDGLLDGTLVVVASDHGEGLGDHGWMEHGALLHREQLRVPLLVRPPGGVAGGRRVAATVRLHDVFATILAACGAPLPAGTTSQPLLGEIGPRPVVAVERMRPDIREAVTRATSAAAAAPFDRLRRSVREGDLHLIVDDAGGAELYDVVRDPGERTNLAASRPADVARLRAVLDAATR